MRRVCREFVLVAVWVSLVGSGWTQSAEEEAVVPSKEILLFDGSGLDHFYTWLVDDGYEDPLRVFSRVDQIDGAPAIRVSGERWGGLVTRQSYRNYRLVVEFRWGDVTWGDRRDLARDSGILLHSRGRDGNTGRDFNGPWMTSVETQIIEGGVGDFILVGGYGENGERLSPRAEARVSRDRDGEWVYDPWGEVREFTSGRINWYGRDPDWNGRLGFRGKRDVESPAGEWTRVEVVCREGEVENWVNGVLVAGVSGSSYQSGKIIFQSEGAELFFRRIELHPLD